MWKNIRLALKTHSFPDSHWEMILPDPLHSIKSFLSTSINTTLHEIFFDCQRLYSCGTSLPSWLAAPGPVMLCRLVCHINNDQLVDEIHLVDFNPSYAHVRYPDHLMDVNQQFLYKKSAFPAPPIAQPIDILHLRYLI